MRTATLFRPALAAVAASALLAISCGTKAPPPIDPMPAAVTPAPSADSAPAAPSQPEPFSLKPGEQLVPHKVAKGESLWLLAQKYNTRVSRIKSANGMTSDMIHEGATIQIPVSGGAAPAEAAPTPAPALPPAAPDPAPLSAPPAAVPSPAPAPAPAPSAPATGAIPSTPSLNFGTPAPAPPASGGIQIQDQ